MQPAGAVPGRRPTPALFAAAIVLVCGSVAAVYYSLAGLALSHYDARAHLVVARRVFDNLVPGWQQIGAVWLPLPHLLDMVPVQIDFFYRTGAFAIAISVASMALAAWSVTRLITRTTGAPIGGLTFAALFLANPNILYLQSTPMTEPLLFGTTMLAVVLVAEWVDAGARTPVHAPGLAVAAACMTRYEAWPIAGALFVLAALAMLRRGMTPRAILTACLRLAVYPAAAILLFVLNSRWTTGEWFVTGGFFVAENKALGHLWAAWREVRVGTYQLSGAMLVWPAYVSAVLITWAFVRSRASATLALLLAPVAAGALPWYAYVHGHPLRVRYSLPLVFAACALCGAGVSLLPRRARALAAALLLAAVLWHDAPIDLHAPMVVEAQRDNVNRAGRRAVTDYLVQHYDGGIVMMSMGSLAHYMQDLSAYGFDIKDFLHEGDGELWIYALADGPHGFTGWVAVEEHAEGGDVLFHRAHEFPQFLRGYDRVAEGGGVALYRSRN
jgi:hypothetical protein